MFYITAIDGARTFLLAGPYASKKEAETKVQTARDIACDHNRNASAGRAWFMAYGVSRWKDTTTAAPRSALGTI
jgi:hypothetical protein